MVHNLIGLVLNVPLCAGKDPLIYQIFTRVLIKIVFPILCSKHPSELSHIMKVVTSSMHFTTFLSHFRVQFPNVSCSTDDPMALNGTRDVESYTFCSPAVWRGSRMHSCTLCFRSWLPAITNLFLCGPMQTLDKSKFVLWNTSLTWAQVFYLIEIFCI